jgi:hypothetical protein
MISFVISRSGIKDYEQMLKMWKHLEELYGKCCNDCTTWDWGYYDSGDDDLIKFVFYDEAIATWFRMQYPEQLTVDEFERIHWNRVGWR